MKIREAFEEWELALYGQSSKMTISTHKSRIKHLECQFPDREIASITRKDLRVFRKNLLLSGLNRTTVQNIMNTTRAFFSFCQKEGFLKKNEMDGLRPIKRLDMHKTDYVTKDDLQKLISNARCLRDELIIRILGDTGVRISGLCRLKPSGCNPSNKTATVLTKGRYKTIYFSKTTFNLLKLYIEANNINYNDNVFKITRQGVDLMLRRTAKRAKVKARGAHAFRHGVAKRLLENGGDMSLVAQVLGHSDIQTTYKYYSRFSSNQVSERKSQILGEI